MSSVSPVNPANNFQKGTPKPPSTPQIQPTQEEISNFEAKQEELRRPRPETYLGVSNVRGETSFRIW